MLQKKCVREEEKEQEGEAEGEKILDDQEGRETYSLAPFLHQEKSTQVPCWRDLSRLLVSPAMSHSFGHYVPSQRSYALGQVLMNPSE